MLVMLMLMLMLTEMNHKCFECIKKLVSLMMEVFCEVIGAKALYLLCLACLTACSIERE